VWMDHSTPEGDINKANDLKIRYVFERKSCDNSSLYKATSESQDVVLPSIGRTGTIFYLICDTVIWV